MNFMRLDDCHEKEINEVGGKAKWLGKLMQIDDINVPVGFCISTIYYETFLVNCKNKEEINRLKKECIKNPIHARKNLSKIRDTILRSELGDKFINDIVEEICELGINLSEGVSVRSSSVCEDGGKKSYAGVFSSTTNVCDVFTLKQGILNTWASQFSELCYVYDINSVDNSMAVVIQEMVNTNLYGVLFSKAPHQDYLMLIEEGDKISQIVDGYNVSKRYFVDREKKTIVNEEDVVNSKIYDLVDIAFKLEKRFKMFCDLEWAITKDKIYLLQCRPQTNFNNLFDYKLVNNDDIEECRNIYLGSCEAYFNKYIGKQYLFRRAVLKSGFSVYKQYFLIVNDSNKLKDAVQECKQKFHEVDFIILEFGQGKKAVMCKLSEMEIQLTKQMANECPLYCRVGELINADKAGYVCVNKNKEVLIEYTKGRMSGIQNGSIEPIKVLISYNKTTYLSEPKIKTIEIIDKNTGKKIRVENTELEYPYLTKHEEKELKSFSNKMSDVFQKASFEWYINKGVLYGKDISTETKDLICNEDMKNVISRGKARGIAYFIEDLSIFDLISDTYDLSLYAHDNVEYKVYNDDKIINLIRELKQLDRPIIIAKRPTNGILPLSEYIGGCIFQHGSILSHIGICMREKNIPSCIIEESLYESIENKKSIVEIEDRKVRIINF